MAQLAFADRVWAGALVLGAIALIAPWAAVGAFAGALFGSLAGHIMTIYSRAEWEIGLSGYNCALIGLIWGGFFATGEWTLVGLSAMLVLCVALEWALRNLLAHWDLPALTMPAMAAITLAMLAYLLAGQPFWPPPPRPPFGTVGMAVAMLCVIGAMLSQSVLATLQAVALAAVTALLFSVFLGVDSLALSGLWLLAVTPASFGIHGVFLPGTLAGAITGMVAALLATFIWSIWTFSGLALLIPPIVAPFILGSWLALLLLRRYCNPLFLQPAIWQAVACLARARAQKRPIVALIGAQPSPDGTCTDYASGCWMNPELPVEVYDSSHFMASRQSRMLLWAAIERFRLQLRNATPTDQDRALAALERQGWLSHSLTQEVDSRQQQAGINHLTQLFGSIDQIECSNCATRLDWPPGRIWSHSDLRCQDCNSLLRPAINSLSEPLPPQVQQQVETMIKDAAVMLIVDSADFSVPVSSLLDKARTQGTPLIFIGRRNPQRSLPGLRLDGASTQTLMALKACLKLSWVIKPLTATDPASASKTPNIPGTDQ